MPTPKKVKLLFAPYHPPPLRMGDRTVYLARDCDVVITSWSDARISAYFFCPSAGCMRKEREI